MSDLNQPIGSVEASDGGVWAIRADGSRVKLEAGDPVFQGDRIETGEAGAIGVEFTDGSAFSLGANGDLVIDEMIYNPATQEGSSFFSVAQGAFSFVSGAIAKTTPDGMMVQTPVATIGVRGTKVVGEAGPEGTENSFTLLREDDGTTGEIVVYNEGGIQVLNQPFQTVAISDPAAGIPEPVVVTQDHVDGRFSATLRVLPAVNHRAAPVNETDDANDESGPPLPQDGAPAGGEEPVEEAILQDGETAGPPEAEIIDESLIEAGPEIGDEQLLDQEIDPQAPGPVPEGGIAGPAMDDGAFAGEDASRMAQAAGAEFGPSVDSDRPVTRVEEAFSAFDAVTGGDTAALRSFATQTGALRQAIETGLQAGFSPEQVFSALSTLASTTPVATAGGLAGNVVNQPTDGQQVPAPTSQPEVRTFNGTDDEDEITGSAGNDVINGGGDDDYLSGGAGNDVINGGSDDDTLLGGAGADTLTGGGGEDSFVFSAASDGYAKSTNGVATAAELASVTRVTDFTSETDKLVFDALGFDGISSLVDGVTAIRLHDTFDGTNVSNLSFQAGSPVLIYDDTGTFYYDSNGAGDGYTVVAKVDGQVEFSDLELENGVSV